MTRSPLKDRDTELLIQRLEELRAEKQRLNELASAFHTVQDSKFARLRRALLDMRALVGGNDEGTPRAALVRPASKQRRAGRRGSGGIATGGPKGVFAEEMLALEAQVLELSELLEAERSGTAGDPYEKWRREHGTRESDLVRMRSLVDLLPKRPKISIVMATYNTPSNFLREAIDSVVDQIYPDWQLCIADDASSLRHVRVILDEYATRDPDRIKVVYRTQNGHISHAGNSALDLATAEYVGFLDHDDLLTPEALFEVAVLLNRQPDADIVYSDEDKIDSKRMLRDPYFKPDWSPDTFLSRMYTCHFSVYRRSLVEEVGRLRPGFEGSQDWDLMLRASERTHRIYHVPRVLYHWRIHDESTASSAAAKPYASGAAMRAIEEALQRRGEPGTVLEVERCPGTFTVRYAIRDQKKVSIIMPTRDHGEDVDRSLRSIFEKSTYRDLEVLLIDNGSTEHASLETFERWTKRQARLRVVRYDAPFNFSKINNFGVSQSSGEYVLLLNNDTEVITPDWIEAMLEQAQRQTIGAVGPLLLYSDRTIQHAGVVVGIGGVAGHSHKHFPVKAVGYFQALSSVTNYSAVTGACMMVQRAKFDEVAGLDEGLAIAFNDIDFCLKLVAAGYRNIYLPHVKLYHFESKSRGYETTKEQIARFEREQAIMIERWQTDSVPDPCYSPNLTLKREDFSFRNGA